MFNSSLASQHFVYFSLTLSIMNLILFKDSMASSGVISPESGLILFHSSSISLILFAKSFSSDRMRL